LTTTTQKTSKIRLFIKWLNWMSSEIADIRPLQLIFCISVQNHPHGMVMTDENHLASNYLPRTVLFFLVYIRWIWSNVDGLFISCSRLIFIYCYCDLTQADDIHSRETKVFWLSWMKIKSLKMNIITDGGFFFDYFLQYSKFLQLFS
jgi:hypothetical protein